MQQIKAEIQTEILRRLANIESTENVKILYACESGSRAWGFESQDSDYDVRFLYVRPTDWYLNIDVELRRDVIELPINDLLDINGWDIRKALKLFQKSNPPLIEWLSSPIVYVEHGVFAKSMKTMASAHFNPIAVSYHYIRMAQKNDKAYLTGEKIKLKKYLYVLRPLLAAEWITQGKGLPPILFNELVTELVHDKAVLDEIEELLIAKRAGDEKDVGPRLPRLHAFIDSQLSKAEDSISRDPPASIETSILNELFKTTVKSETHPAIAT